MVDFKSIYKRYSHLTFKDKVHIFIRRMTVPWDVILNNFPSGHTLIDIGCGHGLFINMLYCGKSGFEKYMGVDADADKIEIARQTENDHISFYNTDLFNLEKSADVYSVFDVLYLIPYDIQEKTIKHIFRKLPAGGYLVIKEIGTEPHWKFTLNRIQETLSVKLFKITLGDKFYFRSEEEFKDILKNAGFEVTVIKIDKGYLHPHILYIGRK